jgi:putative Ca2+/H+ antiporter (TMEM165/GDT1 family)
MISTSSEDPETGVIKTISSVSLTTRLRRKLMFYVSLVFIETFTMTFLAEWGDRSQISTIILAAREVFNTYKKNLNFLMNCDSYIRT